MVALVSRMFGRGRVRVWLSCVAMAFAAAGCGEKDTPYIAAVRPEPPLYCYQTLAGVNCYAKPDFRDERQLINFYGPPPRDYDRPEPPEPARLDPPPEVDWYCRVSEPDACPLTTAPEPEHAAVEPAELEPEDSELVEPEPGPPASLEATSPEMIP